MCNLFIWLGGLFVNQLRMRFYVLLQQLYARLSDLLGLHDHLLLLNVIVGKIATNLKCYTQVKIVLFSCFQIFPVFQFLIFPVFF